MVLVVTVGETFVVRQDENWSLCENGTPPGPGQMSGSKINVNIGWKIFTFWKGTLNLCDTLGSNFKCPITNDSSKIELKFNIPSIIPSVTLLNNF